MAVKELIFNSKNWYEGEGPNYVGKTVTAPKTEITGYKPEVSSEKCVFSTNTDDQGHRVVDKPYGKVLAQIINSQGTYLLLSQHTVSITTFVANESWYCLNDILQNGGVLHSYIKRLCHAVSQFLGRR